MPKTLVGGSPPKNHHALPYPDPANRQQGHSRQQQSAPSFDPQPHAIDFDWHANPLLNDLRYANGRADSSWPRTGSNVDSSFSARPPSFKTTYRADDQSAFAPLRALSDFQTALPQAPSPLPSGYEPCLDFDSGPAARPSYYGLPSTTPFPPTNPPRRNNSLSDFSLASSSSTHTTTSGSSFGNDYSSSTTSLDEQALLYAQEYNRRAAAAGYTLPSSSDRFGAPAGSSSYARQPPVPSFMTAAPPPHQPAPTPVAYSSTNEAFGLPPRSFTPSLLASRQDQPSDYTSRSRRSSMIGPPSTSSLSNFEDGIGGNGGGTDNRLSMMSSGGHPAPPRPRLGPSADAFWPEKKSHQSKGLRPFVNRAVFTAQQREGLETLYAQVMYPEASSMNALAEELEMTEKQVRTWFANRRQSERNAPAGSDYSRRTSYG